MQRQGLALAAFTAFGLGSAAGQTCIDDMCFVDRAQSGEVDLGSLPGGPTVIDYDGDGFMDLYIAGRSNSQHRLYRNAADLMRPGERTFEDVTAASGLLAGDGAQRTGRGAVVADYDNDGDHDLFVLGELAGVNSGLLYRNDDGVFTDVSVDAGVRVAGQAPECAAWLDYDLDGDADLLVGYASTSTRAFDLFENQGGGTFAPAGSALPALDVPAHNYSMTVTDVDGDGWSDVLALTIGIGATLLHNVPDGSGGRAFEEIDGGFNFLGPAPMGISTGDIDGDGDFDIALSNGDVGVYYENTGGAFTRIYPFESYWGWGVSFLDADNDGNLDIFYAGSFASGPNYNRLFRNLGAGLFDDVSPALNGASQDSKNAVRIDIGNDGRPDLVAANPAGDDKRTALYENTSTTTGAWLLIDLVGDGVVVNADALGAVVRVHAAGVTRHREIVSGSSTCSTEDLRAHFGLGGAAQADWIEVLWPRVGSLASRTDRFEGPFTPGQLLVIEPRCLADYNADGDANTIDVLAYLNDWAADDSRADLNGDGVNNTQDVLAFLNRWAAGC